MEYVDAKLIPGSEAYERFWRSVLAPGYRADNHKGLGSGCDSRGQWGVRRFMGQILSAGEESHKRTALLCNVIADGPAQHWIARLERIEDRALGHVSLDLELHLAVYAREFPQMCREHDSDHGSVWTSTESTAGRSRTIGVQLSPAFADAYTCPPVVPK